MKQSYKNLISDTAVFAAGNALTKLIQFVLLPLYTALLTTEQYGVAELVNNTAELLYPLCCLGIYEGVLRYSIDEDSDKSAIFSTGIALALALAPLVIVFGVFGFAVAGFDYAGYLAALCIVLSLRMVCMQFAKGIGKTRLYALSGIFGTVVLCIVSFIMLDMARAGVAGYLIALIVGQASQLVMVVIGARMWRYLSLGSCSASSLRPLLRYSLPMIPNTLAWWFVNLSGRYIVFFFQGPAVAGLYTAASKLPAVINMLVSVFQQAWQIFSAREINSEDKGVSFELVLKVFTAFMLCSGAFVVALTDPIARVLLSAEFYEARRFVPLLMLGAIINGYSTYFGTLYNAAKQNSMIFVTTVVGAMTNVVLGLILCGLIGPWGPIAGSVVAYAVISLMRIYDTRKIIVVKLDIPMQVVGLIVILMEIVVIMAGIPGSTLASICLSVALVVFVFVRYRAIVAMLVGVVRGRMRK